MTLLQLHSLYNVKRDTKIITNVEQEGIFKERASVLLHLDHENQQSVSR
jgi:hypothetical protein